MWASTHVVSLSPAEVSARLGAMAARAERCEVTSQSENEIRLSLPGRLDWRLRRGTRTRLSWSRASEGSRVEVRSSPPVVLRVLAPLWGATGLVMLAGAAWQGASLAAIGAILAILLFGSTYLLGHVLMARRDHESLVTAVEAALSSA